MTHNKDNGAYVNDNITLDPESYRIREVYAYFGLTMFHIQCLERTLSMLGATVYNSNVDNITRSQFDSILEVNFKKTLGQMITQIKKSVDLPDNFEEKLTDALKKRNFLAHHYFWERAMKFSHTCGQEEMIAELSQLSIYFEDMDRELDLVLRKWMKAKGITEDKIYNIMGNLLLSEIKGTDNDEAVKQVMNTILYQILDDAASKKM
ncbi:MAG: hypothetical protein ACPK85_15665 [Methanosarcina sp.]